MSNNGKKNSNEPTIVSEIISSSKENEAIEADKNNKDTLKLEDIASEENDESSELSIEDKIKDDNIPKVVLTTRNIILFPNIVFPLTVVRPASIQAIRYASEQKLPIFVVAQKDPNVEEPKRRDIYSTGTVCQILQTANMPNENGVHILVQSIARAQITKTLRSKPFREVLVHTLIDRVDNSENVETLMQVLLAQFRRMVSLTPNFPNETYLALTNTHSPGDLADFITFHIDLPLDKRQEILDAKELGERLRKVSLHLERHLEALKVAERIHNRIEREMEKEHREYILRKKLKAIYEELGDSEDEELEVQQLREDIKKAKMPPQAEEHALRELRKLQRMSSSSPDRYVIQNYLEWLLRFPWNERSQDNLNISEAKAILDKDHYSLKDVKERILEFLSVRQMKSDHNGPVLCLVGPPGVGKTSIGRSIANALGRKFNRTSLGGVHDEAEIRGHRRTYVGAMPGRIIQAMCTAGSHNPVIMLDEIDKIGKDFRGDPSAALLEALDPEQNNDFKDHYISIPTDLSEVIFILTANVTDTIPPALLDRMEIIRIPGYTIEEKIEIAHEFLLPKALEKHGLRSDQLQLSKDLIPAIIREYTREAGVRNLERNISNLCRKRVRQIVEESCPDKIWNALSLEEIHTFLGIPNYSMSKSEKIPQIGSVHGLSWTRVGGEILNIEANIMPGRGHLTLTGNLGNVMKESARAAITWVRSYLKRQKIKFSYYKHDIHIHVPEGAIPKDGPSAGVTMASAIMSAISNKAVSPDIAMTGEISLTGKVMAVGGIKEKMLAAYNDDIYTVYLPDDNKKDLEDIPEDIREQMNFIFVKNLEELFKHIFSK